MYTTEPCLCEPALESFERDEWCPEMAHDPSLRDDEDEALEGLEIFCAVNTVVRASREQKLTQDQIDDLYRAFGFEPEVAF